LFHLEADVLAEATKKGFVEAIPFNLELNEVLSLAAALTGISGHDEAHQPASVRRNQKVIILIVIDFNCICWFDN